MEKPNIIFLVVGHLLLFILLVSPFGLGITYTSFLLADQIKDHLPEVSDLAYDDVPFAICYSIISVATLAVLYFSKDNKLSVFLFLVLLYFFYPLMWLFCEDVLSISVGMGREYIPFTFFFLTVWLILALKRINSTSLTSEEEQ